MNRKKFVTILGVKIPLENIRSTPQLWGGWVSYRFRYEVSLPPERPWRIINIGVPDES